MAENNSPISYLVDHAQRASFEFFQEEMTHAMLFEAERRNRIYAVSKAMETDLPNGLYVEFGVAKGKGSNLFGKLLAAKGYSMTGFDSFEGLKEDWTGRQSGRSAGSFTNSGALPEVPTNVALIKGWVQDTLPTYLKDTGKSPFSFIHMDMDTYSPTKFALKAIKSRLVKGSVILF